MRESRTKLWIGLGVSVLAGTPLAGAAVPPPDATALPGLGAPAMPRPLGVQVATGPNEGGGGVLDATLALQLELQMMRAYVTQGLELLKAGNRAAAQAHIAHPLTVMYPAYKEILENRAVGFDAELRRLNTLSNNAGTPAAEMEAATAAAVARIEAAANSYGSWSTGLASRRVEVARMLLQAAGNDWVEVGRVDDPMHQKGRGYAIIARELVAGVMGDLQKQDAAKANDAATALTALMALLPPAGGPPAGSLSEVLITLSRAELALSTFIVQPA